MRYGRQNNASTHARRPHRPRRFVQTYVHVPKLRRGSKVRLVRQTGSPLRERQPRPRVNLRDRRWRGLLGLPSRLGFWWARSS